MRCINCGSFALLCFCDLCELELSEFSLDTRKLDNNFKVYSFYKYHKIQHLLHSKHHFYGYFVYKMLAKLSFAKFKDFFDPRMTINVIALDDKVEDMLYSHSAILARYLKAKFVKPVFNILKAQNHMKYSGRSLEFREKHKRNYKLLKTIHEPVILADDIVTTISSLLEAKKVLEENKISVLFALVLADAKV